MSLGAKPDFSYRYFREILSAAKSHFEIRRISQAPRILNAPGPPKLILRHDVDLSLAKALSMAEIENEAGIGATYMVIVHSPLYDLAGPASQDRLRKLIALGHEVGLHLDLDDRGRLGSGNIPAIEADIQSECRRLEALTGSPVRSLSLHRPVPPFLQGDLLVGGRVNAYSRELMAWYLSDSKGSWREGDPLPKLTSPDKPLLQLLIHPIWWGEETLAPEDRLQAFYEAETQGRSRSWIRAFDAALTRTIPAVRRRGLIFKAKEPGIS